MELKEVVNLRKLREEFVEDSSKGCDECPFRDACMSSFGKDQVTCLARRMTGCMIDDRDMYDLERDDDLEHYNFERQCETIGRY